MVREPRRHGGSAQCAGVAAMEGLLATQSGRNTIASLIDVMWPLVPNAELCVYDATCLPDTMISFGMSRGMSAPVNKADVLDIIKVAVEERFRQVSGFLSVRISFDDFENEDVATVRILLDPKQVSVKSEDLRQVSTYLRRELSTKGVNTFPLVRFMSKADQVRPKSEAK